MSKQEHLLEAAQVAQAYESEGGEYALAARHIAGKLREMAEAEGTKRSANINPWHPMSDALALKHLGKLGEEAGELASIVCRCIIQGIDEAEPVTGKVNRIALEEEIADVLANINLVCRHFNLNQVTMATRMLRKEDHLRLWHSMA